MEGSKNKEEEQLMKAIEFYQSGLHRYMERNDEFKMLHSLNKLSRYPIKVSHLKETGVGRTVNLLVKMEGKVGEEATSLINKWKRMVEKEKEEQSSSDDASPSPPPNNSRESNSKYKQRKSESDEEQTKNGKSQAEKENRSTEKYRSSKDHRSNDHKKHESVDKNKHKSSHDRKENKRTDKNENEKHSSRTERGENSPRENDKRREKEKDRNGQRDRSHKAEDKSKKEKERSSHKEKDERNYKDRSERKEKEEKPNKDEKYKEEKSHKKNEDGDRKHKDSNSSSSNSNKKDRTSKIKNHITEISSESGTSFADALGMMEIPAKPKKSDKKESSSSSKHHKIGPETSAKEKKHDKTESSSSSKVSKAEKASDSSKREKKSDKKDSSRHRKSEVSSGSGTSFEDAMEMPVMPKTEKKAAKRERTVLYDTEISSGSGIGFEAALGMMEIPKKKKKLIDKPIERTPSPVESKSPVMPLPAEPLDKLDLISSLLPSITPNYRPIRIMDSKHSYNDQETLNSFMTNKHQRTKIYSGNKSSYTKVPSLFDICVQLLQIHIDAIEGTGGVPYIILKPVLEKATPSQLLRLEYYNSYLTEDSDELWKLHCQKDFKRENRLECETWREMYTRCTDEREARLQTLTANIKMSREKSVPVMQTKIAYIDPPNRNLSRRGAKHLPAAPMAKAKVESIVRQSKAASDVVVTHQGRVARGSSSSSSAASSSASTSSQAKIKKVAPLMAKSLSAFKNRFKR